MAPTEEKTAAMAPTEEKIEDLSHGLAPTVEPSDSPRPLRKPVSFWLSFLALCLMVLIVALDATTLPVALPVISNDIGGTTLEAFWANICFLLAAVIVLPLYINASDVLGRIVPLYTAFFLFFTGSLIFALAPSMSVVIVGRTIQGLGGSGLDALNEIITADMTTLKERPLYLSLMAIPTAAGAILGPIIGALLSQFVSWRWIGWINLPLTGAAFLLVLLNLRLKPLEGSFLEKGRQLDFIGGLLFTVGCAAFVLPLSWAGSIYPWSSWKTLLPFLLGTPVLVVFAVVERCAKQPILPYRLLKSTTTVTSFLGALLHGLVVYNLNTYLPMFIQAVFSETPLQSAITLLPMNIIAFFSAAVSPVAVSISRRYLPSIWSGWVLLTLGVGLLALLKPGDSVAFRTGLPAVVAVGMGAFYSILNLPVQASVPTADDQGVAVGLVVFLRLFGGVIGVALGSTIFSSVFDNSIAALGELPGALAALRDSSKAISFIPQLRNPHHLGVPSATLSSVIDVYSKSFRMIWFVLIGFAGLGLVLALFTKEETMENEDLGRQHFESFQ